jgi:hypothetical protein
MTMKAQHSKHTTARLVRRGMGGFLNPPTHPEHEWSVETDLARRADDRGGASLTAAVDSEWLDPAARAAARQLLQSWQPLPLSHPDVVAWRRRVLGYFAGCYRNPDGAPDQWHVARLVIDRERDPLAHPEEHAGVRMIRQYYPDYAPSAEDFSAARWGAES